MKHKTQAQLANTCRFLAKELSTESIKHDRGQLSDDLLHTAAQLGALAMAAHTTMLDRLTVEPYAEMAVELIVAAQMLRVDRILAKVAIA
jgi:hypothetical protein